MVIRLFAILIFVLVARSANGQSCFAQVQLDRRSVYVQQPFKVTITVLTATWFTAPIEFDNLQIPNAFVLPFDNTVPGMFEHNGKQYAGIQFYFIVFPYKAGDFSIPALTLHATTPAEGSSESRRIAIKTPSRRYTVKAVPDDMHEKWFVARSVSIHEHWNKPLSHVKVGDVIERTITVRAQGTLPQFIPSLEEEALAFANVYPQDPELKDTRDDYNANGMLTQTFVYLLEKEGTFTIPQMQVHWWNPNAGRMSSRHLPEHVLHIKNNPDLGMIATLQDSLAANAKNISVPATKKKPVMIYGMHWYWFVACSIFSLFILYGVIKGVIRLVREFQSRNDIYRKSELYWFKHLMRSPEQKFWRRLYQWWDRVGINGNGPAIGATASLWENPVMKQILEAENMRYYSTAQKVGSVSRVNRNVLRRFRHWLLKRNARIDNTGISTEQKEWSP